MSYNFSADRRNFLVAGGLGLSALHLPSIVESKETQKRNKSVIFVMLQGGISHQESFVVSPTFNERARSVNGYLDTKSGFKLGGLFSELASVSHLFSTVHSFGHNNAGHQGGTHWTMTGYNSTDENGGSAQKNPSYGSILNKIFGTNASTGVPHYVSLNKNYGDGAAYLGNTYNPFNISEEGKRNLVLNVESQRFNQRMYMLNQMDGKFKTGRTDADLDAHKKQTHSLLTGTVSQIFDAKLEPKNIQDMYGKDDFSVKCMLARRLLENGVRFITLGHGGWDMHSNIKEGYANRAPGLDHGLATLLKDLSDRGMLEDTLVVVSSEFSRTYINKDNGRDHAPRINTLLLAGKNYSGRVIGEIDKDGMAPGSSPFMPVDLLATILNHLGINGKEQITDLSGRPRFLVDGSSKIIT